MQSYWSEFLPARLLSSQTYFLYLSVEDAKMAYMLTSTKLMTIFIQKLNHVNLPLAQEKKVCETLEIRFLYYLREKVILPIFNWMLSQ